MFNLDPEKILVICVLALLVLGPQRLPSAARSLGRFLAQLRHMSGSLQGELRDALAEPRDALQHAADEFGIERWGSGIQGGVREIAGTWLQKPAPGAGDATGAVAGSPGGSRPAEVRTAPPGTGVPRPPAPSAAHVPDDPWLN